jgi:hypothetical protein
MICLTAIRQPPGGSSSVHIYTQTIQSTSQNKQYIEQQKIHVLLIYFNKTTKIKLDRSSAFFGICVNAVDMRLYLHLLYRS